MCGAEEVPEAVREEVDTSHTLLEASLHRLWFLFTGWVGRGILRLRKQTSTYLRPSVFVKYCNNIPTGKFEWDIGPGILSRWRTEQSPCHGISLARDIPTSAGEDFFSCMVYRARLLCFGQLLIPLPVFGSDFRPRKLRPTRSTRSLGSRPHTSARFWKKCSKPSKGSLLLG
jgi:hypothetical protein